MKDWHKKKEFENPEPGAKEAKKEEMKISFAAADVNQDGLLDLDEWKVFKKKRFF